MASGNITEKSKTLLTWQDLKAIKLLSKRMKKFARIYCIAARGSSTLAQKYKGTLAYNSMHEIRTQLEGRLTDEEMNRLNPDRMKVSGLDFLD